MKLTAEKFDETIGRDGSSGIIWTAAAIGRRIGRSADYVRRTLSRLEGSPVHREGSGNFYADERELMEFWRRHTRSAA